jgi:adenylate kinase family enzyme
VALVGQALEANFTHILDALVCPRARNGRPPARLHAAKGHAARARRQQIQVRMEQEQPATSAEGKAWPATSTAPSRTVVVGTSGAGKSTFARNLAAARGCPHIELDALFWGPDWQPQPAEVFQRSVARSAEGDCWVADGNYGSVREALWSRATTIVWLNYPFPVVMWRALKRTLRRCFTREALWHDNRESLWRSFFTTDSILVWVVKTHWRRQREFAALRASGQYPLLAWIEFRRPRKAQQWLARQTSRR